MSRYRTWISHLCLLEPCQAGPQVDILCLLQALLFWCCVHIVLRRSLGVGLRELTKLQALCVCVVYIVFMLCWEGLPRLGCCVYCFFFYLLLCCWCVVLYWVSRGSCLTRDGLRVGLMCLLQPLLCLCCQDLPELDFELNLCVYCNFLCFNCACACVRRRSGLVSLQVDMLCLQQPLLYLCCASVSSCVVWGEGLPRLDFKLTCCV